MNMNCLGVLGKKLAGLKVEKWLKNSIFQGGYPWVGGGWGGLCEIFLTDLDPGCVAGEYELSRCVG